MPNQARRSQNETQGQLLRPVIECSKILDAIAAMSLRLGRPMSAERQDQLLRDLENYPVAAIEWAIDNWGKNAKTLPVLGDLVQLLRTWHVDNDPRNSCEPECQARHGRGYGTGDLLWLWKQRIASNRPWDDDMYEMAMSVLDGKREGGVPEWRK